MQTKKLYLVCIEISNTFLFKVFVWISKNRGEIYQTKVAKFIFKYGTLSWTLIVKAEGKQKTESKKFYLKFKQSSVYPWHKCAFLEQHKKNWIYFVNFYKNLTTKLLKHQEHQTPGTNILMWEARL